MIEKTSSFLHPQTTGENKAGGGFSISAALGEPRDFVEGFKSQAQDLRQKYTDVISYALHGVDPAFIPKEKPIQVNPSIAGMAGQFVGGGAKAVLLLPLILEPGGQRIDAERKAALDGLNANEIDQKGMNAYIRGILTMVSTKFHPLAAAANDGALAAWEAADNHTVNNPLDFAITASLGAFKSWAFGKISSFDLGIRNSHKNNLEAVTEGFFEPLIGRDGNEEKSSSIMKIETDHGFSIPNKPIKEQKIDEIASTQLPDTRVSEPGITALQARPEDETFPWTAIAEFRFYPSLAQSGYEMELKKDIIISYVSNDGTQLRDATSITKQALEGGHDGHHATHFQPVSLASREGETPSGWTGEKRQLAISRALHSYETQNPLFSWSALSPEAQNIELKARQNNKVTGPEFIDIINDIPFNDAAHKQNPMLISRSQILLDDMVNIYENMFNKNPDIANIMLTFRRLYAETSVENYNLSKPEMDYLTVINHPIKPSDFENYRQKGWSDQQIFQWNNFPEPEKKFTYNLTFALTPGATKKLVEADIEAMEVIKKYIGPTHDLASAIKPYRQMIGLE